ncbi:Hydrogenase transcriptional regulatory protein hupR1 [Hartmannibacter diazotrophicus]|uniref:Hydrogenase transcriptional regulatory protein hupR1 n=1 Tax=Hartmannibacter diazotrophicus TaxID=1482074 RepID=A0A2C9D190_9HYPH|nr:sigma-54 dependent transcriptional regulator [Hartmannibacter diazotrophicus]SON53949.1 Hydrogenase transcriptional regulatory protein hupR1 [Hartmannibacter diazotrophicus]
MARRPLPAVLVVDDEPRSVEAIERILEDEFQVFGVTSAEKALEVLENEWIQVIFCDQRMPGMSGVELLAQVRQRWPDVMRIIITGYTDVEDIIRSVNEAGIYQFIAKPWHPDELTMAARNGVRLYQLQRDHDRLSLEMKLLEHSVETKLSAKKAEVKRGYSFDTIVRTPTSPMNAVCALAEKVARFDIPALILGESGTGKELIARAIHYASRRSDRPFHAVNCGAIPDELLESELFGHRKGAFTGAHSSRVGLLEQADGGTILLDEIGDTTPAFQLKLLRFLQEGEIRPVGANETRQVDVRVIAATNRDLLREARSGQFREDLYFRLAVSPIRVPALVERRSDIEAIAFALLARAASRHGKPVEGFSREALEALARYRWPGNIRELENQVTRMLMLTEGPVLGADLIERHVLLAAEPDDERDDDIELHIGGGGDLKERVERMEARILRETLARHRWNKSRAAEELGLSRVGLRSKLDRYGILEPEGEVPIVLGEHEDEPPAERIN